MCFIQARFKLFLLLVVGSSSGSLATAAYAQKQVEGGLEEVIVTAQRRSENIQDVPLAITAFSADALAQKGARDMFSLTSLAPNLDIAQNNGRVKIFIRGIGLSLDNSASEGAVAFHQDGVYVAYPTAQGTSFYDIEQIEVLRGPQGTLFGRNATGGAVNIITRGPTEELQVNARAVVGNYATREFEVGVGGPILKDKLLGRLAFYKADRDGFGKNIFDNSEIDNRDEIAVRGKLKWLVTDDLSAEIAIDYWDADDSGAPVHTFGSAAVGGQLQGVLEGGRGAPALSFRDIASETEESRDMRTYGYSLNINYEINDQLTFKSLTGYRDLHAVKLSQYDGTDSPGWPSTNIDSGTHFSQELQLNWDTDSINAVFGLFYFDDDIFVTNTVPFEFAINNIIQPNTDIFDERGHAKAEAFAAFASATWAATEKLNLTAGVRYSDEERHSISSFQLRILLFGLDVFVPLEAKRSWDAWTPRFSIDYALTDDAMVYFTASKGFKSGQILPGNTSPPINPEFIWSYEGGVKSLLFDGRLKANLSAFFYDYSDLQVSQLSGLSFTITNAAAAEVIGFEAELAYLLGQNTQLEFIYGFVDSEYTEFFTEDPLFPALGTLNLKGNPLSNAPEHMFTASLAQTFPTPVGNFDLRVDWRYRSKAYFDPYKRASASQDGYSNVSMRGTYQPDNQPWHIAAWVNNLSDKEAIVHNYVSLASGGFPRNGGVNKPRTFGVEFGYNY